MNLQMFTDQAIVSVCVLLVVAAFYWGIPKLTQALSLYLLHSLREEVFENAAKAPRGLEAPVVRLIDSLIAWSTYVVRDRDYGAAVGFALAISPDKKRREKPISPEKLRRIEASMALDDEIFAGHDDALMEIFRLQRLLPAIVYIRVIGGNPILYTIGFLCCAVALAVRIVKRLLGLESAEPSDGDSRTWFPDSEAAQRVPDYPTIEGVSGLRRIASSLESSFSKPAGAPA